MASFASRAKCNQVAAAELQKITSQPQDARLWDASPFDNGYPDATERLSCYPVDGARWSYAIAYEALSGKPLSSHDALYPRLGAVTLDAENVWVFNRYRSYATMTACNRAFQNVLAKVEGSRNRKLAFSAVPCYTRGPGDVPYSLGYLATTSSGGLTGDTGVWRTINMLSQNGWANPYV